MGIYFAGMQDINEYENIDEIWCIVQSFKRMPPYHGPVVIRHIPQLSPSPSLLGSYLQWKKEGKWNEDTFQKEYVPRFLTEMSETVPKLMLERLYLEGQNKNILCACYCTKEEICHRSIILWILQGMAMERQERMRMEGEDFTLDDYSDYFWQYNKELESVEKDTFYLLVSGDCPAKDYDTAGDVMDMLLSGQVNKGIKPVIISGGIRTEKFVLQYAEERGYEYVSVKDKLLTSQENQEELMHRILSFSDGRKRGILHFDSGNDEGTVHHISCANKYHNQLRIYDLNGNCFKEEI